MAYLADIFTFVCLFACFWRDSPQRARASSITRFLDHTQRRTTVCGTPLEEWSARRRDLYLTTHNTHNKQASMPPVGFEPRISAGERPQTYASDRAATGIGIYHRQINLLFHCKIKKRIKKIQNKKHPVSLKFDPRERLCQIFWKAK
jgi:hypothetical protein